MGKKSYVLAIALLLAVMALAACGGSTGSTGDSAAATDTGAAVNAPASDAEAAGNDVQGEAANTSNDNSGAGDASGGNAGGDAGAATDVGAGSDGAAGSGGSSGASGATSPESDTGAPAQGDDTGNAESGTGGDNAQVASGAATYTAISDAECTKIQGQLTEGLGMQVGRATGVASFSDLSGGKGESCQLTMTGTGVDFTSVPETAALISQILTANGWTADDQYVADGPTGTMGGLRRDNQLAAYNVEWSPASGVTCPADQPISACAETLTPDQMNYNITVDLAQQ